jgi:hypothetical protein
MAPPTKRNYLLGSKESVTVIPVLSQITVWSAALEIIVSASFNAFYKNLAWVVESPSTN